VPSDIRLSARPREEVEKAIGRESLGKLLNHKSGGWNRCSGDGKGGGAQKENPRGNHRRALVSTGGSG